MKIPTYWFSILLSINKWDRSGSENIGTGPTFSLLHSIGTKSRY